MIRRILASSRYIVLIAVGGAFVSAVATLLYGAIAVGYVVVVDFVHSDFTAAGAKRFAVDAIGLIDLFLLGAVLYIVALGLYDLFIDNRLPMPAWLHIASLDDLKEKLIGVVVVLLGVAFLGQVVEWQGDASIWALGVSVALVVAALSLLVLFGHHDAQAPNGDAPHREAP